MVSSITSIITGNPSVVAFDFDLNSAVLVLQFDQIIDASTLNESAVTLQSAVAHRPMESVMLTVDRDTTRSPGHRISIQLSEQLTNEIKRIRNLCTSSQNCYMTVTQFLAHNSLGASNIPINDGSAIIVRNFIADSTPPSLLHWTLEMNSGMMVLYFSETVDVTMFQYDQFTFQGVSQTTMYSLTNSVSTSTPAADVIIELSDVDLNGIKAIPNLGTSENDTFLSVGNSAVVDMSGNVMVPIPSSFALIVAMLIPDFTSPELVSFSLDIGSGLLTLTFSETVNGALFNFSGITLFNGQVSTFNGELQPAASYRLTGGTWSTFFSPVIEVQLTERDLSAINALDNLATSINNTYITADSGSVFDAFHNPLVPISLVDRLQVEDFCHSCTNGKINLNFRTAYDIYLQVSDKSL